MAKWRVNLHPLIVEAKDDVEAEEAAVEAVQDGSLEIDYIEWWDD